MSAAPCAWCGGSIPAAARRDAICCSTRCRQARHRFTVAVGRAPVAPAGAGAPRRLAYADPPYPGLSRRYYRDHPDYAGEVDHAALVGQLERDYDAWALSTSATALQRVLAVCPPHVRVASWHRGERPNARAQLPQNAWEPVVYAGAIRLPPGGHDASVLEVASDDASRPDPGDRNPTRRSSTPEASRSTSDPTRRSSTPRRLDVLVHHSRPRTTDPHRVVGAKPAVFARWVFELLGATPGDEFVDVFPGSGGMARAWDVYASDPSRVAR